MLFLIGSFPCAATPSFNGGGNILFQRHLFTRFVVWQLYIPTEWGNIAIAKRKLTTNKERCTNHLLQFTREKQQEATEQA
jgi:hypothetical protein